MSKLDIGAARREQIWRAAAAVISESGFSGTTMRLVAERAGVSTGMLSHYFKNRMEMLEETLAFSSARVHAHEIAIIDATEPGEQRLRAFLRGVLPVSLERIEDWRVWIAAYGASVRYTRLREVIGSSNSVWYDLLARSVEGLVNPDDSSSIPLAWELDALITGLVIKFMASDSNLQLDDIEETIVCAIQRRLDSGGSGTTHPNALSTTSPN
jgi:TetR/AcrR family transcriptional repressor of bet genes